VFENRDVIIGDMAMNCQSGSLHELNEIELPCIETVDFCRINLLFKFMIDGKDSSRGRDCVPDSQRGACCIS